MNVGEKTNEELAKNIEQFAAIKGCNCDVCLMFREAAARLRKLDGINAKLKVAEDALKDALEHVEIRKNNEYDDSEVVAACDSTIAKCNNALVAIREEGGEPRPRRNCDRFKNEDEADFHYRKEHKTAYAPAGDFIRWLFAPVAEGGEK